MAEAGGGRPVLALTQGDPAGVGPEILLKVGARWLARPEGDWQPLLFAERSALEALSPNLPDFPWDRLRYLAGAPAPGELDADLETLPVVDPVAERRPVIPGAPGAADAAGALAALDAAVAAVRAGTAAALVTAPLAKVSIARHLRPDFRGHTEYLAEQAGLIRYGRDYLMAFLAPGLQVALLSTHLPLRQALDQVTTESLLDALVCLHRHATGRIAVAGWNPHAGEDGLLGTEDGQVLAPAVAMARARGIDAHGPESADSLFARVLHGEFDWVLSLYHDQGLIAVKTASFGTATNWTLGLPYLRTSVDHGTAFGIAGQGRADEGPLLSVVGTTLALLRGELPRCGVRTPPGRKAPPGWS